MFIGFYEDLTKLFLNYHQISNMHLTSSAAFDFDQWQAQALP